MSVRSLRNPIISCAALLLTAVVVAVWRSPIYGAESPVVLAPPSIDNPKTAGDMQTAVLAGGCFWGVQGVFEHVRGVQNVVAGYAGGDKKTAQYAIVSSGSTGHAESVEITFDPSQVSYGQLLQIAFSVVSDPTLLNRQGPDTGSQYRSAVFYSNDTQKHIVESYIAQLDQSHVFSRAIVTRVEPLTGFFPAESYHQDYLVHHPHEPYVAFNDLPKIANFQRVFPDLYSGRPVLVKGDGVVW